MKSRNFSKVFIYDFISMQYVFKTFVKKNYLHPIHNIFFKTYFMKGYKVIMNL